jgi:hypothetical protein
MKLFYFEEKCYSETVQIEEQEGYCITNSIKQYIFRNTTMNSITGLYHRDNDNESATQFVYFRVKDLTQLPSYMNRVIEMTNDVTQGRVEYYKDVLLELATDMTGWYAYDTAKYVGKSRKWVRVAQRSALDI